MRHSHSVLVSTIFIAVGLAAEPIAAQIITEQPGGVAERVYFRYDIDAMATQNSYAVAKVTSQPTSTWPNTSCTGTMVGPNVMLTAAHCHGDRKTATFRAYVSGNEQRKESFDCDYLVHTWPENDFSAHWCFANDSGENPGDKWGYVDFEFDILPNGRVNHNRSRDFVQPNDEIYSIWWNPIDDVPEGGWPNFGKNHLLYSEGQITDIFAQLWANPGGSHCSQADDDDIGVRSDVWGAGGASGSLQFSSTTGRAVLAPLSLAPGTPEGGPSRWASSLIDMLDFARIWDTRVENPLTPPGCMSRLGPYINLRALQTLWDVGIRFNPNWSAFTQYLGALDKNRNGVVDIQEHLERSAGEGNRDFYYINFNSNRLNVSLAPFGPTAAVNWLGPLGFLSAEDVRDSGPDVDDHLVSPRMLLHHTGLGLDASSPYLVLVNSQGTATADDTLRVCVEECRFENFGNTLRDTSISHFAGGGHLLLSSHSKAPANVWDITISTPTTLYDFDTADKRRIWSRRNGPPAGLEPAFIWPQGRTTQRQVDWAGIIRDENRSRSSEFSLSTHLLPIPAGEASVCFFARGLNGSGGQRTGVVQLISDGTSELVFDIEDGNWNQICLTGAKVDEGGSELIFGSRATKGFRYAVDDITINGLPRFPDQPEHPGDGGVVTE